MVSLLEKLPPETIQLDPTRINTAHAPHISPSRSPSSSPSPSSTLNPTPSLSPKPKLLTLSRTPTLAQTLSPQPHPNA